MLDVEAAYRSRQLHISHKVTQNAEMMTTQFGAPAMALAHAAGSIRGIDCLFQQFARRYES